MPRIELIDVPLFGPDDPYHYQFDNLPLKNLIRRQNLINLALDNVIAQNRDAIGNQGSVANRLNQSINANGSLKVAAIDEVLHSIEAHTDTDNYVRMAKSESDKLSLIADGATNVTVEIQMDDVGDDVTLFDQGTLRFIPSSSITWEVVAPNKVRGHLGFPLESAHVHYYDQTPVATGTTTIYAVNNLTEPIYIDGSLRVYINGVRLSASNSIYVPGALVTDPWTLLTYTTDAAHGLFTLSAAISDEDILRIDYDISYI